MQTGSMHMHTNKVSNYPVVEHMEAINMGALIGLLIKK